MLKIKSQKVSILIDEKVDKPTEKHSKSYFSNREIYIIPHTFF